MCENFLSSIFQAFFKNLAALQPEKLEQSNKNLHTQLKELDDLGIRFNLSSLGLV